MRYVPAFDRTQMMMCSWDSFIDLERVARQMGAFMNSLDLTKYNVKEVPSESRPFYNPKGMYKLYIYGNRKGSVFHGNCLKAVKLILIILHKEVIYI